MGVNVDMRYFGAYCLHIKCRDTGLGRCMVSVQLGEERGQACRPARVPELEQRLHEVTCRWASQLG